MECKDVGGIVLRSREQCCCVLFYSVATNWIWLRVKKPQEISPAPPLPYVYSVLFIVLCVPCCVAPLF